MSITITVHQRQRPLAYRMGALQKQRGVVLIITLIVLVAMILASLAMIRSVDTSTVIAGNMAFKQSATLSGDDGIESAINWLEEGPSLEADSEANGYYATSQNNLDLTGNKTPTDTSDDLDWANAAKVKILPADAAGNQKAYVIHRMCDMAGALDGTSCSVERSVMAGNSSGLGPGEEGYTPGAEPLIANRGYYRITVRVTGPRSATSYVQAIVSI